MDDLIVTKTDQGYLYVVSNAGCADKDSAHMLVSTYLHNAWFGLTDCDILTWLCVMYKFDYRPKCMSLNQQVMMSIWSLWKKVWLLCRVSQTIIHGVCIMHIMGLLYISDIQLTCKLVKVPVFDCMCLIMWMQVHQWLGFCKKVCVMTLLSWPLWAVFWPQSLASRAAGSHAVDIQGRMELRWV